MHFHITWERVGDVMLFTTDGVEIGSVEFEFESSTTTHLLDVDFAWHKLIKFGEWSEELSEEIQSALKLLKDDYLSDRDPKQYTWRFLSWNDRHNWYLTDQEDAFERIVG